MEYCGPIGLPFSKFLGWSQDDQDAALAWSLHKSQRCDQCGTFPEDWFDPKTKMPLYPPPFQAGSEICKGCEALDEERKQLPDGRQWQYRLHLKPWRDRESDSDEWPELENG